MKRTKVQKAIDDSIAHWKRMLAWAEKQPRLDYVCAETMRIEINEKWFGSDCALCILYESICRECPLDKIKKACPLSGSSPWKKATKSKTWGAWVKNAKVMIKVLKSLKAKDE